MKRANRDLTEVPESSGDISEVPESSVSDTEEVPGSPCLRKVKEQQHWAEAKGSLSLCICLSNLPAADHPQSPGN